MLPLTNRQRNLSSTSRCSNGSKRVLSVCAFRRQMATCPRRSSAFDRNWTVADDKVDRNALLTTSKARGGFVKEGPVLADIGPHQGRAWRVGMYLCRNQSAEIASCLPPVCYPSATRLLPVCILPASCLHPVCILPASCLHPACLLSPVCILSASCLPLACGPRGVDALNEPSVGP
jgi:hypothetical protein